VHFGIFLGNTLYQSYSTIQYLPIVLILFAIILLCFVQKDKLDYLDKEQTNIIKNKNPFMLREIFSILLLIGTSIIVRSIGGGAIKYDWKSGLEIGLIYTLFIVFGKAFGGLIGDRFGLKKTALLSLAISCLFLILGFNIPIFGYLGIFLFNVPMSITLLLLEKSNINQIATMVGSNTFFLFIGFLITLIKNTLNNILVLSISIILAIISIFISFRIFEKKKDYNLSSK